MDHDDDRNGNGNFRPAQCQHLPRARVRSLSLQQHPIADPGIPKSLIKSDDHRERNGRCIMRSHDLVSDGFLAITAAGFVLLCSSLVAIAFN
jgi:hypothetical protein